MRLIVHSVKVACARLKTMDSLKQLYSLAMDAHQNLRTETHTDTEPRFNERLIPSLPVVMT